MEVPFFTNKYQDKRYGIEIREKLDALIKKGVFISGDEVREFEENIKNYTGAKHAIGVANGSDALYLAVSVLELPENSEVITTPYSFFSSTSCIVRNNLKPVFVDINEDTYNIDADMIEEKITKNTSCILPVDLFSQTANFDKIKELAGKYNLKIVEDSAEAFGMKWKNKYAGMLGDIGVFSFYPTKTLSCFGDGGMILTNDDEFGQKLKILRVHGAEKKYFHKYIGINSRLDSIQAGILNVKLHYINEEIREREKIAGKYFEKLKTIEEVKLPRIEKGTEPVWYVFSIQCKRRDELAEHLKKNSIGTLIYYPLPLHLQECYKFLGYKKGDFPVSEKLCTNSLALPIFIGMTDGMIEYVSNKIKEFYKY